MSSGANNEICNAHRNQQRSEGGDEYGDIHGFLVRVLLKLS
jgi:hypothetical protein